MNGTIDLSSSNQGFSSKKLSLDGTATTDDERRYDEDYSWDETSSDSCSCSSCSTCSLCDICQAMDFYDNMENGNNDTYPQGEYTPQECTIARFPLLSLQEDVSRTTKSENRYQTQNALLYSTQHVNHKKYKNDIVSNATHHLEQAVEVFQPNYVMYSSGSDKERNSSISSSVNSSIIKNADSSSEISSNDQFNGSETGKRKKPVKKRVTFLDTSTSSTDGSDQSYYTPSLRLEPFEGETSRGSQIPAMRPIQNACPIQEAKQKSKELTTNGYNMKYKDKKLEYSLPNKTQSSECKRLQNILKNIDPFVLQSLLQHQLEKKDPRTILTLGKLFPKRNYPLDTIHCVRCHKDYNPRFGKMRCELIHPIRALKRLCKNDELACYRCTLCNKEYWVNILEDDVSKVRNHLGYCYIGTHTPTVDDVSYAPEGAAKSCEDMGCIEFYV